MKELYVGLILDGGTASTDADEGDHSISKKYFKAWHMKKGIKKMGASKEEDEEESKAMIQKPEVVSPEPVVGFREISRFRRHLGLSLLTFSLRNV